ncbi:putative diguanylate cyclase [Posidoniimonas polymericola]|uniref:histidine kinase n=1 Tax=Posidoniimonas polymericola TaxID=2528002 RepID=A0A5C5YMD0_9BACT|nr:PAS domain-containing protein [Posidoniimonas polymericola]TWT76074.1 putative diguanylate cyclase [Posidoniimonas polymericola]
MTNLTESAELSADRETRWAFAMEGNRDGVWDWNVVTSEVFFSRRWKQMLGFGEHEISNDLSEWDKRVHPDDREAVYADLNAHLSGGSPFYHNEHRVQCKDGSYLWICDRGKVMSWTEAGEPLRVVGTHTDITARKQVELENERLMRELQEAVDNARVLRGLLPICAGCKKIRDDDGYWNRIEAFIASHTGADFTHSICPECVEIYYPSSGQPAAE